MKIRRNITKIASVILCAALLTVAMATSAFAAAPTESGMIDIAVSDSDAAFVANHLDALETVRDGALKLQGCLSRAVLCRPPVQIQLQDDRRRQLHFVAVALL